MRVAKTDVQWVGVEHICVSNTAEILCRAVPSAIYS